MTYYSTSSVKVHQIDNNNKSKNEEDRYVSELIIIENSHLIIVMHDPSFSLLHKQQRFAGSHIVNRHNVKFFIRILVGLALAHFIGQRFRPINAAPNSPKSNWKNRPQKVQPTTLSAGKLT